MQEANSKRADILRTDEGIRIHIGNLGLEIIAEPKHFGPLNFEEDEEGSTGIQLWEYEYVARKDRVVAHGEGELIAAKDLSSFEIQKLMRAIQPNSEADSRGDEG
ncbi:hypothetical protein G3I44_14180 [Halogeometricum borinquense]|uniref:Uncharacterized protein n=1 Tax=Halogeometricum borinquense TaxID=60847 RepID=A0A6C0UID8_9EURY|nr:hypothetical protein [Halogeometricum borinquense]QIB75334.1 hypothetical protein G3I44_14180 [Halogeometricum borinquense]